VVYSDTHIQPRGCPRCKGSGKDVWGVKCERCDGGGKLYPDRRKKMAEAFRDGALSVEQEHAPTTLWCSTCRPGGVFKNCIHGWHLCDPCDGCKRETCSKCAGKTTIPASP
jgi:RecJ-like exonuclease